MSSLLSKNPNTRAAKNGLEDIKSSQYFIGFNWVDLEKGAMLSPYIPKKYRNKQNRFSESAGKSFEQFIQEHTSKIYKSSQINKKDAKPCRLLFK